MKQFIISLCLCLAAFGAYAQIQVSGTVVDQDGEPLIGASVLAGKSTGVTTDIDGRYTI